MTGTTLAYVRTTYSRTPQPARAKSPGADPAKASARLALRRDGLGEGDADTRRVTSSHHEPGPAGQLAGCRDRGVSAGQEGVAADQGVLSPHVDRGYVPFGIEVDDMRVVRPAPTPGLTQADDPLRIAELARVARGAASGQTDGKRCGASESDPDPHGDSVCPGTRRSKNTAGVSFGRGSKPVECVPAGAVLGPQRIGVAVGTRSDRGLAVTVSVRMNGWGSPSG
jgi:hypothetical protein